MKKLKTRKNRIIAATAIAALVAGGGIAAASASSTQSAPRVPPWVDEKTGKVDFNKMPDALPASGPDGKILKDKNGKTVMIPTVKGPPPLPQAEQDILAGRKTRAEVEAEQAKETPLNKDGIEKKGDVPPGK